MSDIVGGAMSDSGDLSDIEPGVNQTDRSQPGCDCSICTNGVMSDDLRTRIFTTLWNHDSYYYVDDDIVACSFCGEQFDENGKQAHLADVLVAELDMGIPCATTGCRMRQIARRHAEGGSGLERPDE
jgi:hypothetical protein